MTAPRTDATARFIFACDLLDRLRREGSDTSGVEKELSETLFSITPSSEVVSAIAIANQPVLLDRLVSRDGPGRYMPHSSSKECRKIVHAVVATGEVEATIRLIEHGGPFMILRGDGLTDTCIQRDCPRRLNLIVAVQAGLSFFEEDMLEILEGAQQRLGDALIELDTPGRLRNGMSFMIGAQAIEDITLKQFAFFLTGDRTFERFFQWKELEEALHPRVIALARMKSSNHGQMTLKSFEPSRSMIARRAPDADFFDLTSTSTRLVDAKPIY
ncbi:hypothetical protein ACOI1H_16355 [Loktanella sp. DJP18]|uniref:hypothetical protein n=1 Tax=Loktanella sp. DJP18 TaxID=3409788 RepID=UPI003BB74F3F